MSNTYGIIRSDRAYVVLGRSEAVGSGTPGGTIIPIQDGAGLNFPPKYRDVPGAANNVFDVSYYNGLYYPTIRVPADVVSTWFNTPSLNQYFITRGATHGDPGFDDLSEITGGAIFSDGKRAIGLIQAKGDMFQISSRQDDIVRANLSFAGAASAETVWENVAAPVNSRASFANVQFVSGVSGVIDFQLTIANSVRPNPIFGTGAGTSVTEMNAGKPRITLELTVDATGVYPIHGGSIVFTITPPGASGPVTFTVLKNRIDNPDDIAKRGERASQPFMITCQSPDGITFPITVT